MSAATAIPGVRRYEPRRRWTVEALVWTGDNLQALQDFVGSYMILEPSDSSGESGFRILADNGRFLLEAGTVILRGVSGRVSCYPAMEFNEMFVPVKEDGP